MSARKPPMLKCSCGRRARARPAWSLRRVEPEWVLALPAGWTVVNQRAVCRECALALLDGEGT